MPCPKCRGCLRDTSEELYCLNCGLRPVVSIPSGWRAPELRQTPKASAEIAKRRRERLKKAGLCVLCGLTRSQRAVRGTTICKAHHEKNRKAAKAWFRARKKGRAA